MNRERWSVVAVWLAALLGIAGVGALADPARQLTWTPILLLVLICLSCVLQLLLQESAGFLRRMSLSLVGALAILALGSLVLALLGAQALVGVNRGLW